MTQSRDASIGKPDERRAHFVGFDGLRLFAALAVLFTHAFLIATGDEKTDPFIRFVGLEDNAGVHGVFVFFIISGFLLARSLSLNPSAISYAVNRTLRIFPGFLVCTIVTALLIGPLFSSLGPRAFLSSPEVPRFVGWSLNSLGDWPLPGLFAYGTDDVAATVNGSLWSLRYEALSYVLLLVLWSVFRSLGRVAVIVAAMSVLTWVWPPFNQMIPGVAYTLPYFGGGVLMYWVHQRYGTRLLIAIACIVALVVAAMFDLESHAFAIFGAYLVVFLGERPNPGSTFAARVGDCSYGLYLYNWPAEQIVRQLTGTANPMWLFAMAIPLTFAFALVSYHAIEKPAMRWKTVTTAQINALSSRVFGRHRRAAAWGGQLAFVISAALILVSKERWWYFLESLGPVLLCVVVGSVVGAALGLFLERIGVMRSWRRPFEVS